MNFFGSAAGLEDIWTDVYLIHKSGATLRPLRHVHGAYIAGCMERLSFLYRSGHQRECDMKVKHAPLVR